MILLDNRLDCCYLPSNNTLLIINDILYTTNYAFETNFKEGNYKEIFTETELIYDSSVIIKSLILTIVNEKDECKYYSCLTIENIKKLLDKNENCRLYLDTYYDDIHNNTEKINKSSLSFSLPLGSAILYNAVNFAYKKLTNMLLENTINFNFLNKKDKINKFIKLI